uniref:Iron-containing alcohol dehydrogenase n=1 Tax=Panagrellus redivivus TaxID=6233 RepID=A0A7E4UTR5_PANRE
MFEHPIAKTKTSQVLITDSTSKTAQKAIDNLYGQALTAATHQEVFDVHRFVDKYDIDAARNFFSKGTDHRGQLLR